MKKTSAKESEPQKTQKNQLKWKGQKKKIKKILNSRLTIWWEVLITLCTSQPLSCTWPLSDLWATPLKGVKDFCSATLGSKWRKTGWAEVQTASFLFAPECTLSPPSLQHAVVIAACDLFLDVSRDFWRSFKCSLSPWRHPSTVSLQILEEKIERTLAELYQLCVETT